MKSQKQVLIATMLCSVVIVLTVLWSPVRAEEKQWIALQDNIPQEVERFNIVLKFTNSDSSFYDVSQHNIKSEAIKDVFKKDNYKQQLDFGMAVDGYQYVALIKNASEMNVIGQNSDRLCMVKVLRIKDNKKPEIVKEGILPLNSDIEIPIEISPNQAIVPYKELIKGQLEINMYNDNPVYEGRSRTTLNGTLSGSTSAKKAFLNASLTCRSSLDMKDRYLSLSLKPFDDQTVSASCNGKISDTLMLGSAKLVVEKIASDGSELVLALLDGSLDPVKKQDYAMATIGKPFPSFARVELVKRQLLTLDDMKKQAGADGYIVLIFGDFKREMSPYYGGRPHMRNLLSLDERMISDMLKKDCEKSIIIAFVCQQLALSDLYEKWLSHDPEFRVLSDFSNPLNVFGAAGMDPRMFNPSQRGETLRGNLKFENEKVVTVLIGGNGDTVYLNTDAANELASSLVQINNLMREGKKAEKQN